MIVYSVFMVLAMVAAWLTSRMTPSMPVHPSQRLFIGLSGIVGAFLLAKLPFVVLNADQLQHAGTLLLSGKTLLLGLVGGYGGVELAKWRLNIKTSTGDSFAVPVAVGVGVGRFGCFFGGCCYGTPSDLPWAVVFSSADSCARHPTQIYEVMFHLTMAIVLYGLLQKKMFAGQLIKLYFLSYFAFRFCTEFIRPEIDWLFGLSGYQWAIVVLFPGMILLWIRDAVLYKRQGSEGKSGSESPTDLDRSQNSV